MRHEKIIKLESVKKWNEWRRENPGERIDLRSANLTGAILTGAKGIIHLGVDSKGREFFAVRSVDGYRIKGGLCRWFAHDEAVAHWGNRHDEVLRLEILMRVELAKSLAELYGWKT